MRKLGCVVLACGLARGVVGQQAQKAMGTVPTSDAKLSGGLEVANQRARLISNASVTALDHTAQIDLERGGLVQVCATSAFHLLRSGTGDSLLFALDRGAMEIRTVASSQDAIVTPDLRFVMMTKGVLDLRMRVTREGDTCVDNRGDTAPVLLITEGFGDAMYRLAPKQHVLFEHGSLREVVDREQSNCGCPQAAPAVVAVANPNGTSVATPQQAAALNPFPAAQSEGLAPVTPKVPVPPLGSAVPAAIAYGGMPAGDVQAEPAAAVPESKPVAAPAAVPVVAAPTVSAEPPPAPPGATDIMHKIGRFFKKLFGGK